MSRFQDDDFETYNRFLILSTYFDTDISLTGERILQQGSRSRSAGGGVVVIVLFPFTSYSCKPLDSIIVVR